MVRYRGPLGGDRLGCLIHCRGDLANAVFALGAGRDDHGLFKLVLLDIAILAVDKAQLVMADRDDISVLHGMLLDRKSTRLNSSHQIISYAVFCLKKKKNTS